MKFPEYFDPKAPSVADIMTKYAGRFYDCSTYRGLTHENAADALMHASRRGYGLILPEGPGAYQFWDRGKIVRVKGQDIQLNSALRFMKFGPSLDITKRGTTSKRMRDEKLTPRKLFKEVLGSDINRERLLNGSYRGIGWWDPKAKKHRLLPLDVPAEGEKFRDFHSKWIRYAYQHADAYVTVPSVSRDGREYIVTLRVLPISADGGIQYNEWAMTESPCGCKDRFFRGAAGQAKIDEEAMNIYKYAVPEEPFCRHGWGALMATQERGEKYKNAEPFQVKFPIVKGLMGPWYVLSTATIIKPVGKRARRPLKTEVRIQLGRAIGHAGPDYMFDLIE